jgi:hypothetical protein
VGGGHRELKELDPFLFEGVFFIFGTYAPDVAGLSGAVVDFQGFFRKIAANVVEIFFNKFNGFLSNFGQGDFFR